MTDTLYPGLANSPETKLLEGITAEATAFVIADSSSLPDAPNIAVLGKKADGPETVRYTEKDGAYISGVVRAVEGTAKPWPADTPVARNFTAYDFNTLIAWISSILSSLSGKAAAVHTHSESDVSGLATDLSALATAIVGKAAATHSHAQSEITDLVTALAAKAASTHSHAISDITNLATSLAAKLTGSVGTTDNAVPRADGTGGATLQSSGVIIDDSNNVSGFMGLDLVKALASSGNACGFRVTYTAAETTAQFQAGYINSSGKVALADADASSTMKSRVLALAAISANADGLYLVMGFVRNDSWSWTVGGDIFVSGTTGALTQTSPSASGAIVQVVGYAVTSNIIFWCPSLNNLTMA